MNCGFLLFHFFLSFFPFFSFPSILFRVCALRERPNWTPFSYNKCFLWRLPFSPMVSLSIRKRSHILAHIIYAFFSFLAYFDHWIYYVDAYRHAYIYFIRKKIFSMRFSTQTLVFTDFKRLWFNFDIDVAYETQYFLVVL